jgi:hypothetical protein
MAHDRAKLIDGEGRRTALVNGRAEIDLDRCSVAT